MNFFGSKDKKSAAQPPRPANPAQKPQNADARPQASKPSAPMAVRPQAPQQRPASVPAQAAPVAVARRVDQQKPVELTPQEKEAVVNGTWTLLTGPKGTIAEITENQALYVALVREERSETHPSRNTLLVAKDYELHPETSTVLNHLRRKGIPINRQLIVDMQTIRQVYEKASAGSGRANQMSVAGPGAALMQATFIKLLEACANNRGSDIHIKVERYTASIQFRVDGVVAKHTEMPAQQALELCNAVFNMTETSDATYKPLEYQQARMTESSLKGLKFPRGVQSVRLQFNPLPAGGRYLVARLLYDQRIGSDADIDELGYTANQLADIRKMRRKSIGINIICGPTGSGKSTTLQRSLTATLRERSGINVITIEDPPEYIIEGAKQLPVVSAITQEERTRNFQLAMNAVLRDDPDVIMIGEIRDGVSANLAYTAAETGHGVWASLHANSAIGILDRLRDLGLELYKLCDATKFTGFVSQRLVRRIHPDHMCDWDEAVENKLVSADVFAALERVAGEHKKNIRFAATHKVDASVAFKGRIVCAEAIVPDQRFLDLYQEGKKGAALEHWKTKLNGMDMLEAGLILILTGVADVRAVEEVVGLIEDIDPARVDVIMKLVGV